MYRLALVREVIRQTVIILYSPLGFFRFVISLYIAAFLFSEIKQKLSLKMTIGPSSNLFPLLAGYSSLVQS